MFVQKDQRASQQNAFKYIMMVVVIFVLMVAGWTAYLLQRGSDGRVLAQSALAQLRRDPQSLPAAGLACHELLKVPLPETLSGCVVLPTEPPTAEVTWQDGRKATVRALQ